MTVNSGVVFGQQGEVAMLSHTFGGSEREDLKWEAAKILIISNPQLVKTLLTMRSTSLPEG